MGSRPYLILDQHLSNIHVNKEQDIVLEVGTENGEGSTDYFFNWANKRNMQFYSVDVVDKNNVDHLNFIKYESGSSWCKNVLPNLNKKIKVLYLDNFDWIRPGMENSPHILNQIKQYADRGVVMNNNNCEKEHLLQAEYCLPHMAEESVIIMDDTELIEEVVNTNLPIADTWRGKCRLVIPLLMKNHYVIENYPGMGIWAYRQKIGSYIKSTEVYET